jgi:glycosyltransferase involved in cell wall biosynthesis
MRIAYITAGAAGMFCGSCMHDNTLAAALIALGHDALLLPTYTPIRTDEADVSQRRVFLGGINVYLQQKLALFRHTPRFLDRLLDAPMLLRWVSRFAVKTQARDLAELTISVLRGEHGHQKKEIDGLVDWLANEYRPDIVVFSNVLLAGIVEPLRRRLKAPVLATLQGDDIFLDFLPEPYRRQAMELVRAHCQRFDGFIATSRYYADFMREYLGLARQKVHVVYPGLNLKGFGASMPRRAERPFTVGYFARVCPEKGLHVLIDAFILLKRIPGMSLCKLRISGFLGENNRAYFEEQKDKLRQAQILDAFEHVESPDHATKVRFFQSIDVLSVPTTYREPKGLYVLEALACGVPVVQPRHGSFPELIEATGGGLLVEPNDPAGLAQALRHLLDHPDERAELGRRGKQVVFERFHAQAMAEATLAVFREYLP